MELESKLIAAEASATGIIVDTFEGFDLIRDYGLRHAMTYRYENSLGKSKTANDDQICFKYWNAQLVPWLTLVCVSLNLALGAQAVLIGKMSVGSFLAMVQIYQEVGSRFQGLYESLAAGMQAGSPLCGLTKMLNLPTDMLHRLGQTNARRKFMMEKLTRMVQAAAREDTAASRESTGVIETEGLLARSNTRGSARGSAGSGLPFSNDESPFDQIPVSIVGLSVDYIGALSNIQATVQPGSLVFITGSHGTGKATLVRFLADIFVPDKGCALFSAHNRCLHVSKTPEVMAQLSLYQNLTFGAEDDDPRLVRNVVRRLGLDTHWIADELQREVEAKDPGFSNDKLRAGSSSVWCKDLDAALPCDISWTSRLSHREKRMISLARAFICNPEILVLQKPLDDCDLDDVETILKILREYVDDRGILKAAFGRPRTVFFSGGTFLHSKMPFEMSDVIWNLHNDHGLVVELGGGGKQTCLAATFRGAVAGSNANIEDKFKENIQRSAQPPGRPGHNDKIDKTYVSASAIDAFDSGAAPKLSSPYGSPRQIKMSDPATFASPRSIRSGGSSRSKEIAGAHPGPMPHRANRHKEFFGRNCCAY